MHLFISTDLWSHGWGLSIAQLIFQVHTVFTSDYQTANSSYLEALQYSQNLATIPKKALELVLNDWPGGKL